MVANKKALAYEIVGVVFIIFLGSALHFTYALSGKLSIVGSFSAVNESVWEHMKLAFWPSLIWLIIEHGPLRKVANNFFVAKALGTYLMAFTIPIIFYAYTSVTRDSIFAIDITTFVVAIIIGQILSYKILNHRQVSKLADIIALVALVFLGIGFTVFTFYTPHWPIFQDTNTGGYGIG